MFYFVLIQAQYTKIYYSKRYGDFKQAYTVVDRMGLRVLRDPFSSKPFVLFYTTKRTGGDVTNFEAFAIQKTAA